MLMCVLSIVFHLDRWYICCVRGQEAGRGVSMAWVVC
jgi:hypothetical protein